MNTNKSPETSFDQAWQKNLHNDGDAAQALAKLILCFWDYHNYPCSLPECFHPLDSERRRIAIGMITHYIEHGAEEIASRYVRRILAKYPHFKRQNPKAGITTDATKDIADLLWKTKRVLATLGQYLANHEFADANAEAGRLSDIIEIFEGKHPPE